VEVAGIDAPSYFQEGSKNAPFSPHPGMGNDQCAGPHAGGWTEPAVSQPRISPVAGPTPSSMEIPLRLIAEARQSYQGVTDYTCLFVKQENLHGQLQPQNLINMWARTKPFSVYMYWKKPNEGRKLVMSPGAITA